MLNCQLVPDFYIFLSVNETISTMSSYTKINHNVQNLVCPSSMFNWNPTNSSGDLIPLFILTLCVSAFITQSNLKG